MDNTSPICIQTLAKNITCYLSDNYCKNTSVVKINNENLAINGELYFLLSLKAWESSLKNTDKCAEKCATILQHFFHKHVGDINDKTDKYVSVKVLQLLISYSSNWPIKIEKYLLKGERVCLFLQRAPLIEQSIKEAVSSKCDFGRTSPVNKVYSLKSIEDKESELTSKRLQLIQSVTERVLNLHGCKISDEHADYKFIFTSKSQGNVEDNYVKCICGVVKTVETNCKETQITWQDYVQNKIKELKALNEHKYFEGQECNLNTEEYFLKNLANAAVTFELLSVKPSHPVFIGCGNFATDKATTNTKGASFILYNAARISAIIEKYNDKVSRGEYPNLPHINNIDFSLLNQEDEWEIVYNFIIRYQLMIKDCLRYEPFQTCPQAICIFLIRLCSKFSIYYRKTRILIEAYDHLIPTMTARLYMLHALQVVLRNALAILDIHPVSRM
ncbi:DALR anticodon-binding domain-containing protein 3 isoform X2 [Ceratina calcarata]|uniref:DALR anticodon-binding domain-containing protein 3 isoform X2 n=1 Tax=Ceratina calcarata TaxID=156304 RepID=A0AAJ7N559_9HYME|nr:DALR anticodon-binding domain-containing protein 3 isoform X2 [Ceratina calcarata]